MIRWTVAGLIVVGLLVGIWMVWPSGGSAPTTVPEAAETTTTRVVTSTAAASTTTTVDPLTVRDVETVERAEAILRELWFGWFEGIYNQDEDRIREVVATEEQVETAMEAFGSDFLEAPQADDISFDSSEVLRKDDACLVVWTELRLTGFREGATQDVHVVRWIEGIWKRLSVWEHRDDLWETDCEAVLS